MQFVSAVRGGNIWQAMDSFRDYVLPDAFIGKLEQLALHQFEDGMADEAWKTWSKWPAGLIHQS